MHYSDEVKGYRECKEDSYIEITLIRNMDNRSILCI